ncbi:MAG TPA: LCP family protein, partial [Dehalococcoidia bacterium]|nr:LCP family protein [Dehalococcoidia bacterium]
FTLGSAWAALVVVTRVDGALFPGNELDVPGSIAGVGVVPDNLVETLPGVEGEQFEFSDPEDRINILVLGLDTRPEDASGTAANLTDSKLTDTLFVVSVDPASKTASIISFPRDLYVEIPFSETRILEDRINAAYECGLGPPNCREPYAEGGGPALAMATLEYNFDIRIDHYMIIDWEGFKEVINTLGGVEIDVPEELGPPESGNDVFDAFENRIVPEGRQTMNGDQALGYSRFRGGPDGDFGRIERQQQMMFAVMGKAVSLDLINPGRLQELWGDFRQAVETDIRDVEIPGLSLLASRIGPEDVTTWAIEQQDVRGTTTRQGASVLLPIHELVNLKISEALADPQVRAEGARIVIENASGDDELAEELFAYLVEQGFPIGQIYLQEGDGSVSAAGGPSAQSGVRVYGDFEYTVDRLLDVLGLSDGAVATQVEEGPETEDGPADIVIVVGEGFALDR